MLRQPRIDAPGTLHHVMDQGIEANKVLRIPGVGSGMIPTPEEGFVEPRWASWGIPRRAWPGSWG